MKTIFVLVMISYMNPGHVHTVRYYDTIGECQQQAWDLNKEMNNYLYQCWIRNAQ